MIVVADSGALDAVRALVSPPAANVNTTDDLGYDLTECRHREMTDVCLPQKQCAAHGRNGGE